MPSEEWIEENRDRGLLLDPGRDFPHWYLEFREDGSVHPRQHPSPGKRSRCEGHSRGEITIKVLDLDGTRLRSARRRALVEAVRPREWVPGSSVAFPLDLEFVAARRQVFSRRLLFDLEDLDLPRDHLGMLIQELAEELAAELAHMAGSWNPPNLPLEIWAPVRRVLAREWPELDDEAWRRLLLGERKIEADLAFAAPAPAESHFEGDRVLGRSARITEIRICNFKAVEDVTIELPQDPVTLRPRYGSPEPEQSGVPWVAFLGENGSGKSCILQAVGLALAGDRIEEVIEEGGLEWRRMLRRGAKQGRVFLRFLGGSTVDLRFNARRHWWHGGAPRMEAFVRGYGATRLLEGGPTLATGGLDNLRLGNLFDPRAQVLDAERWLLGLPDGDFHAAALTLSGFLGDERLAPDPRLPAATPPKLVDRDPARAEVTVGGDPLTDVSDGYRAVIAMVCDVIAGLGTGLTDMRHATGMVLIDELGSHLHPRWKMEITSRLRWELPDIQFLVSTHEPLCLRGLYSGEVVRIRKTPPRRGTGGAIEAPGYVTVEPIERSPSAFRVDQLLTSEFFGLDTTIDPDLDRRLQAYYSLLALTRDERVERQLEDQFVELKAEVENLSRPVLGHTRRDQLVYEAIDEFLQGQDGLSPENRRARRRETIRKVHDIWRTGHSLGDARSAR